MKIVDRTLVNLLSLYYRLRNEDGQGLAEYGLILSLVAIVVVAAVTLLGKNISTKITSIAGSI